MKVSWDITRNREKLISKILLDSNQITKKTPKKMSKKNKM